METSKPSPVVLPCGVWPVMLTPFQDDNGVDMAALDELVEWYLAADVAGLFAVCLSSEMFHLDRDERYAIAERVLGRVAGRVPVIVSGAQGRDVQESVDYAARMYQLGASAVVCTAAQFSPKGSTPDDWRRSVERFLDLADPGVPLGLYECPQPYHRLLSPQELGWLVGTGRFVCLKDTSCSAAAIRLKLHEVRTNQGFRFYNANVPTLLDSLRAGVHGFSGIAANFCPELYVWLCREFESHPRLAEELQDFLSVSGPLIVNKYPTSSKVFLGRAGLRLRPNARVQKTSLAEEEYLMLEALRREIAGWRERLGIGKNKLCAP